MNTIEFNLFEAEKTAEQLKEALEDCGGSEDTLDDDSEADDDKCDEITFATTVGVVEAPEFAIQNGITAAGGADDNSGCLQCIVQFFLYI